MRLPVSVVFVGFALLVLGCDSRRPTEPTRYFRFIHESDSSTYVAATSDPEVLSTVDRQLEKPLDERGKFITGPIERGDGGHNHGYDWHFVPDEWALTQVAVEVCDGHPDYVNDHLDTFVDEVGRYCPWHSRVLEEIPPPEE